MKYVSVRFMVFLLISLIICGSVQSQNMSIGVKGGLSIPNLKSGGSETPLNSVYSSRKGADLGCYVQYDVPKLFGVSAGIEYCAEGGKKNGFRAMNVPAAYKSVLPSNTKYVYADFRSEAKLDCLLFPILARAGWNPFDDSSSRIYSALGIFVGLLVGAKQVTRGSGMMYLDENGTVPITPQPVSFNKTTDTKSELHVCNVGAMGFVGVWYESGRRVFISREEKTSVLSRSRKILPMAIIISDRHTDHEV